MTERVFSPAEQETERWRQLVAATEERLAQARRDRDAAVERADIDAAMGHQATVMTLEPVLRKLAEVAEHKRGVVSPMAALYVSQIARNQRR